VESTFRNRTQQFVIDGEAVVLGVDGVVLPLGSLL
jgi:hypothetical protein